MGQTLIDGGGKIAWQVTPVEVVATYELYEINQIRLENMVHRIFGNAQLDIEIPDRFGRPVKPREWFLVSLFVIDEAVRRIDDGTISGYAYDPHQTALALRQRGTLTK